MGQKKRAILVAYGVRAEGKRELIDFMVTSAESETRWWRFLNDLNRHRLRGDALGLIVTDGNAGLENAVDIVYSFVKR